MLNLNHNRIQAIPSTISTFSALSVLSAARNGMSLLAIEVTELPSLTMLDLSVSLPEAILRSPIGAAHATRRLAPEQPVGYSS